MSETAQQAAPGAETRTEAFSLTDALSQKADDKVLGGVAKTLGKEFKTRETLQMAERAVLEFCRTTVEDKDLVSDQALETLAAMIAAYDEKLSKQMNLILHHPDFQKLEGSWRGLEHMVFGTETAPDLKIRVLNIRKQEMGAVFKRFKGAAWDQSPLFKKIYGPYNTPGGYPYGVLIGDFEFNQSKPDLDVLKGMAQIAAASHAPFIAGADPKLMNMDSWLELDNPRRLDELFQGPDYAGWQSFRKSEDAKYASLAMPRYLSRMPYGKDNPVEGFDFNEDYSGDSETKHGKYTWSNSAYAMGTNITQAFKQYGWCSCIWGKNSGGEVTGLNCHTFPTDDGGVDMKCPTEISIGDRRDGELADVGLMDLRHWQNTDTAAFGNARSLYQFTEYDDPDATSNSKLNAELPCIFAVCRFAHFIKVMVREAIGQFKERSDMESWLNRWITNYVSTDPNPSEEVKARLPLAAAEVKVEDVPGSPGFYAATFWLRPWFQLQGLKTSLRLVSTLPSKKQK